MNWSQIERAMYEVAIVLGFIASVYTIRKFQHCCRENRVRSSENFSLLKKMILQSVAVRLLSYKISLSVADALILFVYAPTQVVWITTFWVSLLFWNLFASPIFPFINQWKKMPLIVMFAVVWWRHTLSIVQIRHFLRLLSDRKHAGKNEK